MSYPTGQGPSSGPAAGAPLTAEQDRQWASLAHLGGILSFPPALIIWLVFKDRGSFTNEEGKEALNFQLTLLIGYVALNLAATILGLLTFGLLSVISSLGWVLWLIGSIFSVLGYLSAKDGRPYRYPFSLRLIS
ncbi:DUF4870 domain-containing protein [Cryobacterium adonitolivorans]|uniref:DUF4870 domain-containing protein n=1 Tax=Cryobacterium adonitolivorans TaxID=1259189 RepID=A0A4R8WEE1_9MICO|nr:DUF4870 domain-containing protein [Cryobacterium adonitolivorans]TFC05778.1 DUF4870 domain-containing protein [Cryobacterium adonitolivorans]